MKWTSHYVSVNKLQERIQKDRDASSSLCFSLFSPILSLEDKTADAEWDSGERTVGEGKAGRDFNVMQEARSEKEEWKEEGAHGGSGPWEDASKEHLSQRPAGSLIRERSCVCVCVCFEGVEWKGCISSDR